MDVGQRRTGVQPGEPARELARAVAKMPGLELVGLQGYEGHLQHIEQADARREKCAAAMRLLVQTADLLRDDGLRIDIVSTGGTGTAAFAGAFPGVTEVQPGSYVVMDGHYGSVEGVPFEQAISILATVISRSRPGVATLDAGFKAASIDSGLPAAKGIPGAQFMFAGDEYGLLHYEKERADLGVGDKIELVPHHCDTTINLHDVFYVVRDGRLEDVWPIAARGKIQ